MLDARLAKAGLFHPALAVGAGVVEAAGGFDKHVQAHHQAERILGTVVIDDAFIDDERPASGEGFVRLANEQFLFLEIPVMEDVPHHDDVGARERIRKEASWVKLDTGREVVARDVLFKDGSDFGKIESDSRQMRMGQRHLRDEISLGGAYVYGTLVFAPGKLGGDGQVGAVAEAGHGAQELFEPRGIGIERRKKTRPTTLAFVLLFAGA